MNITTINLVEPENIFVQYFDTNLVSLKLLSKLNKQQINLLEDLINIKKELKEVNDEALLEF